MSNAFAVGLVPPFNIADQASVTLAATLKALWPVSAVPIGQFFELANKAWKIEFVGRFTSAVTPGNLVASILYGTGGDANGVTLASSTAQALTASQANMMFNGEIDIECRTYGTTGTLFATGWIDFNEAIVAPRILIPGTAAVVSAACDLTSQVLYPNLQFSRSGSTAETAQIHKVRYYPLN